MKLPIAFLVWGLCVWAGTSRADEARRSDTEHFRIEWQEGVSAEAVAAAEERAEHFYALVADELGEAPEHPIVVLLQGPAEQPDGSWGYPRVDQWGRVHLYQFGPSFDSYFNPLAHELVHVFRLNRRGMSRDWFFEEGFAEFVALRVDPSLAGFPWYEFPIEIAAGQWLATGEDIPLAELRENHRDLNLPCRAQSYTLRSAFFDYLGDTYGDEAVLEMAGAKPAGALADYAQFFGKPFDQLTLEWRGSLLAAYGEIEDSDEQARRYRHESPIQYMDICGTDEE